MGSKHKIAGGPMESIGSFEIVDLSEFSVDLECPRCGTKYGASQPGSEWKIQTCPRCGMWVHIKAMEDAVYMKVPEGTFEPLRRPETMDSEIKLTHFSLSDQVIEDHAGGMSSKPVVVLETDAVRIVVRYALAIDNDHNARLCAVAEIPDGRDAVGVRRWITIENSGWVYSLAMAVAAALGYPKMTTLEIHWPESEDNG